MCPLTSYTRGSNRGRAASNRGIVNLVVHLSVCWPPARPSGHPPSAPQAQSSPTPTRIPTHLQSWPARPAAAAARCRPLPLWPPAPHAHCGGHSRASVAPESWLQKFPAPRLQRKGGGMHTGGVSGWVGLGGGRTLVQLQLPFAAAMAGYRNTAALQNAECAACSARRSSPPVLQKARAA